MFQNSLKWFIRSIPKAPKKAGLLMRIYYLWQENFTPAGHAAVALFPLSMVLGMIPGFWAAWVFCGLDFLLFLGMMLTLFAVSKRSHVELSQVAASPVYEGDTAVVEAFISTFNSKKAGLRPGVDCVQLGAFRLHPALKCVESAPVKVQKGDAGREFTCEIVTTSRGAYNLECVAAAVPEIMGLTRWLFPYKGSAELIVFPRPFKILTFPFLTLGSSGMRFAPLLMPSLTRGMNFVGVREYREGDSLRDLHHKAFARYGRPFTKEFEAERGAGVILLLDTAVPGFSMRKHLENAIRLTAGVGLWLMERGILGRFFINNDEISLTGVSVDFLKSLARIPEANLVSSKKNSVWAPAARPMDPVLRIGLYEKGEKSEDDSLIQKHVVVGSFNRESNTDKVLLVDSDMLGRKKAGGVAL